MAEKIFNPHKDLSAEDEKIFLDTQARIEELKASRDDVFGVNLESIWEAADKDYRPHELQWKGKKVISSDEEKGWRSTLIELNRPESWRSDISQPNPYIKINTALAILVDRNPTGILLPGAPQYEQTTSLMRQLYERSWEVAKSLQQLKLFMFNLAKYGWAIGRTYPLKIEREVRTILAPNEQKPAESKWRTRMSVEYNDVFRENLDPYDSWIDDMARPNNRFSMRDWCWRKYYPWEVAEEEFNKYPNWKFVRKGNFTLENKTGISKRYQEKDLVEIYFYENRIKDLFVVVANGIPIIIEPLPISDAEGNKKLSCWQTYWTLRHAECPYGIGIYESIRNDQTILDRIRNMTIDQLTLSIYKMFFYQGTELLTETGEMEIKPGHGKQVLNPQNLKWLEVPPPGIEAWRGIEMLQKDMEESSGITPQLAGEVTGQTAFEIAQARESALKRLKTPLGNICEALEDEAYITISLIQLLYSIPEVIQITDKRLITEYLLETKADAELFFRDRKEFYARLYRKVPINLDTDNEGRLVETPETRFFQLKPSLLQWEGIIRVKPQSILTPSKQLDKALDLEMLNMAVPLIDKVAMEMQIFTQTGQQATLNNTAHGKTLKNLFKIYDKNAQDWLPDAWLLPPIPPEQQMPTQPEPQMPGEVPPAPQEIPPVGITGGVAPENIEQQPVQSPQAETAQRFIGQQELPTRPQGPGARIVGRLQKFLRGQ